MRGALHGLVSKPKLIGQVVTVQRQDVLSGRWIVTLVGGEDIRVLDTNLMVEQEEDIEECMEQ